MGFEKTQSMMMKIAFVAAMATVAFAAGGPGAAASDRNTRLGLDYEEWIKQHPYYLASVQEKHTGKNALKDHLANIAAKTLKEDEERVAQGISPQGVHHGEELELALSNVRAHLDRHSIEGVRDVDGEMKFKKSNKDGWKTKMADL